MNKLKSSFQRIKYLNELEKRLSKLENNGVDKVDLPELKQLRENQDIYKKDAVKNFSEILIYFGLFSVFYISLMILYTFGIIDLIQTTRLYGYGAHAIANFDIDVFLWNLSVFIIGDILLSIFIVVTSRFIRMWIDGNEEKRKQLVFVLNSITLYSAVALSLILSLTSDQLSIITSIISVIAVLRFAFNNQFNNVVSLINIRTDNLFNKNDKVKDAALNESSKNHEETNDE
jgi:hypothetical protein